MSKIVFWSPLHGQGQTSNLHIISIVMSLIHKRKVLMMQTSMSMNNLEGPLIGKKMEPLRLKDNAYFQDIGLDAAVMYSRMNMLMGDTLESCCVTFPNTSLLLLPATETRNRETFERDISSVIGRMILHAENSVDIVMIDSDCGQDDLSIKLMSSADVIVINLTQRMYVLNKFFLEYGEMLNNYKNVFFLFGNYNRKSGYNMNNCLRKYRKYINKNNSGTIPYCTKYMDAQNDCNILDMAREGLYTNQWTNMNKLGSLVKKGPRLGRSCDKETEYFFYQVSCSAIKIINMINTSRVNAQIAGSGL